MKIVVLDGYTLNPGDLSWESLKTLGKCSIYKRTPPEKIIKRAIDADVLLTNKAILVNQAHGNTRYRTFNWYSGIHQGHTAAADGSH